MPEVGEPFSPVGVFSSVWIPPAIFHDEALSATAKLCYGRIAHHCGKRDYCWPSQEVLAKDLGASTRTVRECIAQLADRGFIRVQQLGLTKTNRYYLLWFKELDECLRRPDRQKTSGQEENESDNVQETSGHDRQKTSGPIETNTIEQIQTTPPTPPPSLDLSGETVKFIQKLWLSERNVKLKLKGKNAWDGSKIEQLEERYGRRSFRYGALAYLRSESEDLRENQWPIKTFISQVREWVGNGSGFSLRRAPAEPRKEILPPPAVTHAGTSAIDPGPVSASGNGKPQDVDWDRLCETYPGEVNPTWDYQYWAKVRNKAAFWENLDLWMRTDKWREGFAPKLENFLKKEQFLYPPRDVRPEVDYPEYKLPPMPENG